jgi:hypothetical protein
MKKLLSGHWLRNSVSVLVSCFLSASAFAQFNPPGFPETSYPPVFSGNMGLTPHTSAYALENVQAHVPMARHLAVAGWDDAGGPSGVSWQFLDMAYNPVLQGTIPYVNVQDLEVGLMQLGGGTHLLVAYYDIAAPGHRLDIYDMSGGAPVWVSTTPLSAMPNYTRISMDCHMQYAMAIAWEDANGINTIVGLNGPVIQLSGILTLNGTLGDGTVDLAFSHNNMLNVQYVYYNPFSGNITQSEYDFWTAIWLPTQNITPTINDVNQVGTCRPCGDGTPSNIPVINKCPYMNIDCPDHYAVDNWAYTYTTDNANISVRYLNLNASPIANTVIVNDNSVLPSAAINTVQNIHPFCTYDTRCGGQANITVAWHTSFIDPATLQTAGYVALKMDETGTILTSPLDYLTVAANPTWASITPVLSMSKKDDLFSQRYIVFPEYDPGAPDFRMQNKYPSFCTPFLKGNPDAGAEEEHTAPNCNDEKNIAEFMRLHGITKINASPNPFRSTFRIDIPLEYLQEQSTMILTDVLGNVIAEYTGGAREATAFFETKTKTLPAGSYFLNVNIDGKLKETLKMTKSE